MLKLTSLPSATVVKMAPDGGDAAAGATESPSGSAATAATASQRTDLMRICVPPQTLRSPGGAIRVGHPPLPSGMTRALDRPPAHAGMRVSAVAPFPEAPTTRRTARFPFPARLPRPPDRVTTAPRHILALPLSRTTSRTTLPTQALQVVGPGFTPILTFSRAGFRRFVFGLKAPCRRRIRTRPGAVYRAGIAP